jgi:quercetin dioxygenase-like cupin family protein
VADWFVWNVRDATWFVNEKFGARSFLVPPDARVGVRIHVLEPRKPSTLYHRETGQEGFLVVEGEALLIVDGEERPLKQWDYFHCAPDTPHAFVGTGDGPCVMVTVGLRSDAWPAGGSIVYERNDAALAHAAGVEEETDTPSVAYEPFPKWEEGRPASWDDLPWNRP